jgi:putative oxygen-independent coproporphyrinogen III oxidase
VSGFGVYVHIPFCDRRCDYCDFATWTDRHHLMARYAAAVVAEAGRAELSPATSVFFGGGTPSLLPAELLAGILEAVARAPGAEVTVECNPDTVTAELMRAYRAAGVNRLSFGVQSMDDAVLAALGRTHDRANVARSVELARAAGFDDLNLDLIYGGVGETVESWRATLAAAIALEPTHVSAYALTVEAGTPLAADPARHPDDDDQAVKYLVADELLADAGFASYEISNWARPGRECRHNLLYWSQGVYRGLGCAAHSHQGGRRFWNVRTPDRYIDLVESGRSAEGGEEVLDDAGRRAERLQLSLRTRAGVPEAALAAHLDLLTDADLVAPAEAGRVALTTRGRLMANEVAARLSDPGEEG